MDSKIKNWDTAPFTEALKQKATKYTYPSLFIDGQYYRLNGKDKVWNKYYHVWAEDDNSNLCEEEKMYNMTSMAIRVYQEDTIEGMRQKINRLQQEIDELRIENNKKWYQRIF